jgi:nucleoside-diphosphate-sugar epimerase
MRVFVAGASGAIGRRLVPQLVAAGHGVVATTRTPDKADRLRRLGAEPVVLDGLDAIAVGDAVARTAPDAIVHQMTALTDMSSLRGFDRTFSTTNLLRTKGLDHLLAAARATGVRGFVAQSYTGWTNPRSGGPVKTEADGLDPDPLRSQRATLAAIAYLEQAVTDFGGVVLRYGSFYGPGASEPMVEIVRKRKMPIAGDGGGIWSWCHLDDAASATVAALQRGQGVYNIVDDDPAPAAQWLPYLAEAIGAKPPRRVPAWLARLAAGEVGEAWLTEIRGSSNAKAKAELSWAPRWSSWRDGFRYGLSDVAVAANE